ncbi:MAG TPA: pyridoxal-phosphate dependent enzyme [Thermodesulfobacteriota bacterium]|nr:pyridoxal-phosphate dependent enzyme [Thermodesulfobacteriota bacterium]
MGNTLPLFRAYPELYGNIPWISIGKFPSPVERLSKLEKVLGVKELWIKRDDLVHSDYGGNKVRKLEFILADVKSRGAKTIITAGALGSNHALALTVHSRNFRLKPVLVLFGQPVTRHVRRNLLLNSHFGAEIYYADSYLKLPFIIIREFLRNFLYKKKPVYVPAGGTTPLSTLGYLSAAFELKGQIERGDMPKPDYIFVSGGTGGTMAGLILGSVLSGLDAKVIGVRVTPKFVINRFMIFWLINKTVYLMKEHSPKISSPGISLSDVSILTDYLGKGYGYATEKSKEAVRIAALEEGLRLEETYTGKSFAAFLDFARTQSRGVFLFWNTVNSLDLNETVKDVDCRSLPQGLHKLFTCPPDYRLDSEQ